MTIKRNRFWLIASLALIGFTMKTALADEWDKEMILSFSAPVQVPGHVLQPGKYVFRLADDPSNRNIVQIFSVDNNDRWNFVATILTVSDYRMMTPDKPMVQFEERHLGDPEAIKSWFYPGDNTGWHFVYPKSEQLQVSTNVAPPPAAPAPEAPAPPPAVEPVAAEPVVEAVEEPPTVIEEVTVLSQLEFAPNLIEDDQNGADRLLPETAGHTSALLMAGITVMGAGLLALSLSLRKVQTQENQ